MTPAERTSPRSPTLTLPRPRRDGHLVAAILGSHAAAFELGTAHEVFGLDRSEYASPWYRFRVIGAIDTTVPVTDGDWFVSTPYTLDDLDDVDTVILPVWPGRGNPAPPDLLDGRQAATHWRYAPLLARRFPLVHVVADVLYVDGEDVLTSAGTAAGIDLCLHLVRKDHGAAIANRVARRMVVAAQRDGGQAQFVDTPVPAPATDDPVAGAIEWALGRLAERVAVEDLARRAHLSPRQFSRRFRAATGASPAAWLLRRRLDASLALLESSDEPVEQVAARVGFPTPAAFRRHFARAYGVPPSAWRRNFAAR